MLPQADVSGKNHPPPVVKLKNNETGRSVELTPVEMASVETEDGSVLQYQVEVTPAVLSSLVDSKQKWDSSRAVLVTIWMYYNQTTVGGNEYTSVDRYSSKWQIYDSSVKLSNAFFRMGCNGDIYPGTDNCTWWSQNSTKFTPSANVVYSASPYWKGRYVQTMGSTYQSGSSNVTLKRGTSTWSLAVCIYQGSCGGGE